MSVRIYGNQHGSYITFTGKDARILAVFCRVSGWTPERLLDEALNEYIKVHHPDYRRWTA